MNKMTQDMIKTVRTIKMMNTQKGRFLLYTGEHRTGGQTPCEVNRVSMMLRSVLLVVMMVLGATGMWADDVPFEVTTDPSAKHYYLLQNVGNTGVKAFYAMPYSSNSDETKISTTNVPNSDMRFYFMNVENEDGYYYIIHWSGKYLYAMGNPNDNDGARLKSSATLPTDGRYKFSIERNGEGYYIINKELGSTAPFAKRGGNSSIANGYFLKWNTWKDGSGNRDDFFRWNFIPISETSPLVWTPPFVLSTEESRSYYKIQHREKTSFYISRNTSTDEVNTSATDDNNRVWYFEEVPAGENGSDKYITYYYIVHALTGKYMCFDGVPENYATTQANAARIQTKTEANEQNCQFVITRSGENDNAEYYNIIPKALKDYYWNHQCIALSDNNSPEGKNVFTKTDRENNKQARWKFGSPIVYTNVCETPTISCTNGVVTIESATSGSTIYYTTDGTTPDPGNAGDEYPTKVYDPNDKPTFSATTTIKAIATKDGVTQSLVATETITQVEPPTIAFNDETHTITLESETTGSTIYYRIGETGDFTQYENPFVVGPGNTIEAYAVKEGCINSETNSYVAPDFCVPPVFTVTESTITITCSTTGSRIYYTEDGTDPDLDPEATVTPTLYEGPISATERKIIKAIAVCDLDQSGVVTLFNRPAIVLRETAESEKVLSEDTYTYNGEAKTPAVTMVAIKRVEVAAAEYEVLYSNNTEAGTATVMLTDANEGNNIVIKNASATFTINKAPLTVTAVDQNIAYGEAAPDDYTISYEGFFNSETEETEGVFTTAPTAACTYVMGNDAGTYPIIPSGGVAKNYSLVYHNGTLTVGPKVVKDDPDTEAGESQITIVLKEDDNVVTGDTYTYDGTAKEPTVTVKVGDNVIAASEYTVAYTLNTNAGSGATGPAVTITDKAGGNYAVSGVQTFTIKKASLTVKANDVSAIYGSMPVYTFSYTGFIEGETAETAITTPPTVSCDYNNVGTYDIVPSGGEAPNYELTYVEGACKGTLTVDPKTVKDNPDTEAGESAVTIELSGIPEDGYVYDGTAKEPTVTVKDGDTVIDAGEYTVGYSDNTNAGTATVTITDKTGGNYNVSGVTTFDIHPTSIGDGIQPATGYTVSEPTKTGNTYSVTVKEGETPLTQDVDYELVASPVSNATYTVYDNEIASIRVKGKGNYGGSVLRIYGTLTYWSSGETDANKQNVSPFVATEANLDSPAGVTPYIISGINMTKHELKLKAVSYIPKDVPVLLLTGELDDPDGDGKKTASFIPMPKEVEEGSEEDTSMNLLKVSEDQTVGAGQTYALYHGKFWLTSSGTLTAGKFYFDNPNYQSTTVTETVGSAPPMRLVFEDMTGVEEVRRMMDDGRNDRWYTLDGRQLQGKPAKKGLYIKNGRKMVVME